jgi:hypothetical protein
MVMLWRLLPATPWHLGIPPGCARDPAAYGGTKSHPLTLLAESQGLLRLLWGHVTLIWNLVGEAAGHIELAGVQRGLAEG